MKKYLVKTQKRTNGMKLQRICIWHPRKNILEQLSNVDSIGLIIWTQFQ